MLGGGWVVAVVAGVSRWGQAFWALNAQGGALVRGTVIFSADRDVRI